MSKREKKRGHKGLIVLLVLAILVILAYLKWGTVWKDAKILAEEMDLNRLELMANLELGDGFFEQEGMGALKVISTLEGRDPSHLSNVSVYAKRDENNMRLVLTPQEEDMMLEVFLGKNGTSKSVVNGGMIYNEIRDHVVGGNALLDLLAPRWEEHEYMTFDQAERLFGADLSTLNKLLPDKNLPSIPAGTCFLALCLMQHKQDAYTLELNGATLTLHISGDEGERNIKLEIVADQPMDALNDLQDKLQMVHLETAIEKFAQFDIRSCNITVESDEVNLDVPTEYADTTVIDTFIEIMKLFK